MERLIAIAVALFAMPAAQANTIGAPDRHDAYSVKSEALEESREIFVRLPIDYDPENETYPVVYVLDGEWNFELVAAYLDYMADNDVYPPLIVTGARNVNRNRDYLPVPDDDYDDTGGADAFLQFVADEWMPNISKRYPASGKNILIGHSFGGVFTLHTLFTRPELFDAYIALSASAWIGDNHLTDAARAYFAEPGDADAFVFMAAGEGDGGPTTPSGQALADLFAAEAPASLQWRFEITPKTDHFKNFVAGMHQGFMALFPAWNFEKEVLAAARTGGADGVAAWFDEKDAALGYRFQPAWFDFGVAAYALMREDRADAAIALIERLKSYHPDNAHVAAFAAGVYERAGRPDAALYENARALELVEANGLHPNELHKGSLERRAARLRDAQ